MDSQPDGAGFISVRAIIRQSATIAANIRRSATALRVGRHSGFARQRPDPFRPARVAQCSRGGSVVRPSHDRALDEDKRHAGQSPSHELAAGVLDRQFASPAPNPQWVADLPISGQPKGWLYAAAVLDLFSRRIASCQWLVHDLRACHRCAHDGGVAEPGSR